MAAYYVLGILLVVWALALSAFGLARADFPPSGPAGRALVGATALIVLGALVALLVTTHREHPREEAAAKALEKKQEAAPQPPPSKAPAGATKGVKQAKAIEKEFSITLAGGNSLKAGKYTFDVQNAGKIQHDLAIQGKGSKAVTPLIDGGQSKTLRTSLKAGKYKFYCTVPGHEQAGMKLDVTVK
jgi:plastocyanin